ncbi:MAG: hypothetical protein ABWX94_01750 [Candidatus Saccharimonadales bacterium]
MVIYTFRTFPHIDELRGKFGDVFVFSELKRDLAVFETILEKNPDQVIGIALIKGSSRQEPIAINRFNKGKILAHGEDDLELTILDNFPIAQTPTHSFCNWTMYRIQSFIDERGLSVKFSFIHINKNDLALLDNLNR